MKKVLILLIAACTSSPNIATSYVSAVDPDAQCIDFGHRGEDHAVLCRSHAVLFYCATNDKHRTTCQPLADMNPKPTQSSAQPTSTSGSTPIPTPTPIVHTPIDHTKTPSPDDAPTRESVKAMNHKD